MANLYYVDENGSIKTIANVDSPSFINEPRTNSLEVYNNKDILNIEDATKYIDRIISEFNLSRLIYSNSNILSGLAKKEKYLVSIYGKLNPGNNNTYNLGPVAITNSSNVVLKTSGIMIKNLNNPMMPITQNAAIIIDKAPDDGIIYGYVNFNTETGSGVDATCMVATRLS